MTTIHGLEWNNPLSPVSVWQKNVAIELSDKTMGIGKFLEKYLDKKFDLISFGASSSLGELDTFRRKNSIVYVGRLEENTGLLKFLKWLDKNKKYAVNFCGDGPLRNLCSEFGDVHGFVNPSMYYKSNAYCVPGGYLAALEALNADCELKLFWNNRIKEDYWKMSPFYKLKGKEIRQWAKSQTWEKVADEYLDLYNSIK